MSNQQNSDQHPQLSLHEIEKAIRISYVQSVLSSIYITLVSGMFIVGFALKLGANNAQIGLMTTLPMFCVIAQLFSAILVERGVSRRKMTTWACTVFALGWSLVMAIPFALRSASSNTKISVLIAVITSITLFYHMTINARSSWMGDLIPPRRMGEFFGKNSMYASIVATIFGILGGRFLDDAKGGDISAFGWIFFTASTIGLINAFLHLPQADVPLQEHETGHRITETVRATFANKDLMRIMVFVIVWSMQSVCAPFGPTYLLRDMHISYTGLGIINSMVTLAMLLSSSFWGRMVNHYGCRPILIVCTSIAAVIPIVWIWITDASSAYYLLCPANFIGGFEFCGITVALSPLIYSVTPKAGRSGQLAIYSIVVVFCAAPMPAIGGHLINWFKYIGIDADLRCTFWTAQLFLFISVFLARRIKEPNSRCAKDLARNLPRHLVGAKEKV